MKELIDLKVFRKKNRLSQGDIASFLGTSRGYISMVEKGKSKLSDEKIQRLFAESPWDTKDLVPHYDRFLAAWDAYNVQTGAASQNYWPLEDINPFGLSLAEVQMLFYGEGGIDDGIAARILEKLPTISLRWLQSGEGRMFVNEKPDNDERILKLERELSSLKKKIKQIEECLASHDITIEK